MPIMETAAPQKSRLYEFDQALLGRLRKIAVFGDIHGDHDSLQSLLKMVDLEKDFALFLGDYVDRGKSGVEVVDTIASLIKNYPSSVVALKGNHEDYSSDGNTQTNPWTLIDDVREKGMRWTNYFQDRLKPFIDSLYLSAIIPGEALFVHGGISSRIRGINDLRHPNAFTEEDVLWSDPSYEDGEPANIERGFAGVLFGKDVTDYVCRALGVKRIIRSHQPRMARAGPHYMHSGRVVTTSSTAVYGGKPFILAIDPADPSAISHYFP